MLVMRRFHQFYHFLKSLRQETVIYGIRKCKFWVFSLIISLILLPYTSDFIMICTYMTHRHRNYKMKLTTTLRFQLLDLFSFWFALKLYPYCIKHIINFFWSCPISLNRMTKIIYWSFVLINSGKSLHFSLHMDNNNSTCDMLRWGCSSLCINQWELNIYDNWLITSV